MAFEINDGQLTFDFQDGESVREKYRTDVSIQADVLQATGGDQKWASAILQGPSAEQLDALKTKHETDPAVIPAFDQVYGRGAAEHYINQKSLWDVATAPIGGIQSAVGETALWLSEGISTSLSDQEWTPTEGVMQTRKAAYLRDTGAGVFSLPFADWGKDAEVTQEELSAAKAAYLEGVTSKASLMSQGRRDMELDRASSMVRVLQARRDRGEEIADFDGQMEGLNLLIQGLTTAKEAPKEERDLHARKVGAEAILNGMPAVDAILGVMNGHDRDAMVEAATVELERTLPGQIVAGVSQFVTGYVIPAGAIGKIGLVSKGGLKAKAVAGLVAGMVTDATAFNPDDPQFIDFLETNLGADLSGTFLDYVRKDEGDSDAEKRFKAALEGAGLGVAAELLLHAAAKGYRKVVKGKAPEAQPAAPAAAQPAPAATSPKVTPAANPVAEEVSKLKLEAPGKNPSATDIKDVADALSSDVREARTESAAVQVADAFTNLATVPQKRPNIRKWVKEADIKANAAIGDVTTYVSENARKLWEEKAGAYSEFRTFEEMREATAVPAKAIMELAKAGDVKGMVDYAIAMKTPTEAKVTEFAFMTASDRLKDAVSTLSDHITSLQNVDATYRSALVSRFDKLVEVWAHADAINRYLGSEIGARLGQRNTKGASRATGQLASTAALDAAATKQAAATAKGAAGAADKEALQELLKSAQEATKVAIKEANAFWKEYDRLRKMRPDAGPEIFKFLYEELEEAKREGLKFGQKPPAPVEDVRSKFDKVVDGVNEYAYSSMLSGVRTFETNILSGVMHIIQRLTYEGAYSLALRDPQMRRAFAARLTGMISGSADALRSSIKALKEGRSFLSETHTFVEGGRNVIPNSGLGRIVRLPLSIMAAQDQLLKSLWYRGEIAAKAAMEADLVGLKGNARKAYIDRKIVASVDEYGRGVDLTALAHAEEIPFQKRFRTDSPYVAERAIGTVVNAVNNAKNPWVRLAGNMMFPFTRIMFRLMDEGVRLTPGARESYAIVSEITNRSRKGVAQSSKWGDDLAGRNGRFQQARAFGELSAGYSLGAFAWYWAQGGMLTGGEPSEYIDAALKRQTVPPYHIRIGDTWYDYSRFDPLAFPLKVVANAVQSQRKINAAEARMEFENGNDRAMAVLHAAGYIFAEMFTNNSFTEGIDTLMGVLVDQDGAAGERVVKGQLEKLVPNILKKVNEAANGTVQYKANDAYQALQRHFSWLSDTHFGLDVNRDQFLGEPVVKKNPGSAWTNFAGIDNSQLQDPVFSMLLEMNEATGRDMNLKAPWAFSGIKRAADLRQVRTDDGSRSLYDFYLSSVSTVKLEGKTYRQALEDVAVNGTFRKMTWGNYLVPDNEKTSYVAGIKKKYEAAALEQLKTQKSFMDLMEDQAAREAMQAAK